MPFSETWLTKAGICRRLSGLDRRVLEGVSDSILDDDLARLEDRKTLRFLKQFFRTPTNRGKAGGKKREDKDGDVKLPLKERRTQDLAAAFAVWIWGRRMSRT
jgi:hypothetical protein